MSHYPQSQTKTFQKYLFKKITTPATFHAVNHKIITILIMLHKTSNLTPLRKRLSAKSIEKTHILSNNCDLSNKKNVHQTVGFMLEIKLIS